MSELPQEMIQAFDRLERKMQRERQEKESEALRRRQEEEEIRLAALRRKKRLERMALGATFAFAAGIGAVVWYADVGRSDAAAISATEMVGRSGKGAPNTLDCTLPRNKYKPVCREAAGQPEANWQGISRGERTAFTLHKPDKPDK